MFTETHCISEILFSFSYSYRKNKYKQNKFKKSNTRVDYGIQFDSVKNYSSTN